MFRRVNFKPSTNSIQNIVAVTSVRILKMQLQGVSQRAKNYAPLTQKSVETEDCEIQLSTHEIILISGIVAAAGVDAWFRAGRSASSGLQGELCATLRNPGLHSHIVALQVVLSNWGSKHQHFFKSRHWNHSSEVRIPQQDSH